MVNEAGIRAAIRDLESEVYHYPTAATKAHKVAPPPSSPDIMAILHARKHASHSNYYLRNNEDYLYGGLSILRLWVLPPITPSCEQWLL